MAMETTSLVINMGSASKKYALYEGEEELATYHFEKEDGSFIVTEAFNNAKEKLLLTENEYTQSTAFLLKRLKTKDGTLVVEQIGIRVVAPGTYFHATQPVTQEYITKLEEALLKAPLHIAPTLEEIKLLPSLFPGKQIIAVSDSAFHTTMTESAQFYALPIEIIRKYDIYRFGYHGISMQSIMRTLKESINPLPQNIIICHLGSGSSIAAIKDGKSYDTSMGFTPLEGLPMGTRVGNIDPGVITHLAKQLNLSPDDLDTYLNTQCGLHGLSGKTADVRELLTLEQQGDEDAERTLNYFNYHVKKYIGAYTAALNGIDLIVFTAGIGERSSIMRARILNDLDGIGIKINKEKNETTSSENISFIEDETSRVKIAVIKTNEMKEIMMSIKQVSSI
ncbi:MAG: acetate/propionate family kinase [Parcubacteria group bacterium]|nr:acetate/propionate family kinase [Parcubacteria group bacterium]